MKFVLQMVGVAVMLLSAAFYPGYKKALDRGVDAQKIYIGQESHTMGYGYNGESEFVFDHIADCGDAPGSGCRIFVRVSKLHDAGRTKYVSYNLPFDSLVKVDVSTTKAFGAEALFVDKKTQQLLVVVTKDSLYYKNAAGTLDPQQAVPVEYIQGPVMKKTGQAQLMTGLTFGVPMLIALGFLAAWAIKHQMAMDKKVREQTS